MPREDYMQTHRAALYDVVSNLIRLDFKIEKINDRDDPGIEIRNKKGKETKIGVKGLMGTTNWPFDREPVLESDFYIFVSFLDKFNDIKSQPEFFIISKEEIKPPLLKKFRNRSSIYYTKILNTESKDAWYLIE